MIQGIQILTRPSKLRRRDWYRLVEERVELVLHYATNDLLNTIGDVCCITDDAGKHSINQDENANKWNWRGKPKDVNLDTLGIFHYSVNGRTFLEVVTHEKPIGPKKRTKRDPFDEDSFDRRATESFWVLTKDGRWLVVTVEVARTLEPYFFDPDKKQIQGKIRSISIKEHTLREVCTLTDMLPRAIWEALGSEISEWFNILRSRFGNVQDLLGLVQIEEDLLRARDRED